ncbi:MAG: hypothetical protein R2857_15315 [Vampirovibrionales bacterium]
MTPSTLAARDNRVNVNGGSGYDTLNLNGQQSDWARSGNKGNYSYYNAGTNTRVNARGIEQVNNQ